MAECEHCCGSGTVTIYGNADHTEHEAGEAMVFRRREIMCSCQVKELGKARLLLQQWVEWMDRCGLGEEPDYEASRRIAGMPVRSRNEGAADAERIASRAPDKHGFGYCPACDCPGVMRRKTTGRTTCKNGHDWIPEGWTRPSDKQIAREFRQSQKGILDQ